MRTTLAEKQADKRVEQAYYAHCYGIQIDIMDIAKVFARGRQLVAMGASDEELGKGILEYVQGIRRN